MKQSETIWQVNAFDLRSRAAGGVESHISLTLAVGPLVFPAPCAIGRALNVGGPKAVIARIAGEDNFGPVLVMGSVNDPPSSVLQRERPDTWANHNCGTNAHGDPYLQPR